MSTKRYLSENDVKQILELRDDGFSRRKISQTYKIAESTIYLIEKGKLYKDVLQKLGRYHEQVKDRSLIKLNNRKLSEENIIEIFHMKNKGIASKNIYQKFNISGSLLSNIYNGKAYNDIVQKHNLK